MDIAEASELLAGDDSQRMAFPASGPDGLRTAACIVACDAQMLDLASLLVASALEDRLALADHPSRLLASADLP
jgi:hypothetical protein